MTRTQAPRRSLALVLLVGAVGLLAAGVCLFQALILIGYGFGGSWGFDRPTVLTLGVLVGGVLGVTGVVRLVRRVHLRGVVVRVVPAALQTIEAHVSVRSRSRSQRN